MVCKIRRIHDYPSLPNQKRYVNKKLNKRLKEYAKLFQVVTSDKLKGCIKDGAKVTDDAEWRWTEEYLFDILWHKTNFLTNQIFVENPGEPPFIVIVWKPGYRIPELDIINKSLAKNGIKCPVYLVVEDPMTFNPVDGGWVEPGAEIHLIMYYAPQDLRAFVGNKNFLEALLNKSSKYYEKVSRMYKGRKLNATFYLTDNRKITVIDVVGMANNNASMDSFLHGLGFNNHYKKLSKYRDKARMELWMSENPESFLLYAIGDVLYLSKAVSKRVEFINKICEDSYGFSPNYTDPSDPTNPIPGTSGALVSSIVEMILHNEFREVLTGLLYHTKFVDDKEAEDFDKEVLCPLSGIVATRGRHKKPVKSKLNREEPLKCVPNTGYHPLSFGSICGIVANHKGTTGVLNAIVYGGRCINERFREVYIEDGFDADLASCYGKTLSSFSLAIGFPKVISYLPEEKVSKEEAKIRGRHIYRETLGALLHRLKDELVPNQYSIVVSGMLNFDQDYQFSKLGVTTMSVERDVMRLTSGEDYIEGDDGHSCDLVLNLEREHIRGDMKMLRNQIVNGVITHDGLDDIRKFSSDPEYGQWMNLDVQTMIYYPKSEQLDNPLDIVKNNENKRSSKDCSGWFPFPLSKIVDPLLETRKRYIDMAKRAKTKSEKEYYTSLEQSIKLLVNTIFGCFASPYFRIGNVVLANNITAKARSGVWKLSKALGTVQSITDGGAYANNGAREIVGAKLPSMHTLSDYNRLNNHRSIRTCKLVDNFDELREKLKNEEDEACQMIDKLALDHTNKFLAHYGTSLPFDIKHKYENTFKELSWNGNADYCIDGKHKIRGVHDKEHVKAMFLHSLITGDFGWMYDNAGNLTQTSTNTRHNIGIKEVQSNPTKYIEAGVYPGDSFDSLQYLRPNEMHFPLSDEEESKRRDAAYSKEVVRHEKDPTKPFGSNQGKIIKRTNRLARLDYLIEQTKIRTKNSQKRESPKPY